SRPWPSTSICSTAMPRSLRCSPIAAGSPSIGAKSRSQDSRTFIGCTSARRDGEAGPLRRRPASGGEAGPSELGEEADVVGEEVAQVVDAVAGRGQAVDAEAEREPLPLVGVEPAVAEHVRVDHAAAAQLEP